MQTLLCLAIAGCATPTVAQAQDLALAQVGDEAVFVDLKTVKANQGVVSFRALRVFKPGAENAGRWQDMIVDCQANESRTLSFQRLAEDAKLGPDEPLTGQIFPISPASPEAGMADLVCDKPAVTDRAASIADALKLGRARLSGR